MNKCCVWPHVSTCGKYFSIHSWKTSQIPGVFSFLWLNGYYDRATMPKQWEHRLALNARLHPSIAYWSNHSAAEPTNRSSISQLLLCCPLTLIWKHTSAVLHPRLATGRKSGPGVKDFFFSLKKYKKWQKIYLYIFKYINMYHRSKFFGHTLWIDYWHYSFSKKASVR